MLNFVVTTMASAVNLVSLHLFQGYLPTDTYWQHCIWTPKFLKLSQSSFQSSRLSSLNLTKLYLSLTFIIWNKGKGKGIAVCETSSHRYGKSLTNGITQCYLPPCRGDFPAFTPTKAGTRFSNPEGMQGWVDLGTMGVNSLPKMLLDSVVTAIRTRALPSLSPARSSSQTWGWLWIRKCVQVTRIDTYRNTEQKSFS